MLGKSKRDNLTKPETKLLSTSNNYNPNEYSRRKAQYDDINITTESRYFCG